MANDLSLVSELGALAAKVRASLREAQVAACNALHAILNAGDALITAKEQVPDGEWTKWLRANCFMSRRSALLYMQIARHRNKIEVKIKEIPDLSLRAACRLVTKAREKRIELEATPESVDHRAKLRADWQAAPRDAREAFLIEILTEINLRPVLEAMSEEQKNALERRAFGSLKSRSKTRRERSTLERLRKRQPYLELEANPTNN
jgi:Protein of unknown function (DUF3102)